MTWKELKEFCNSLDEKQLQSKVLVWREEECISKLEPITLSEDYYNAPEEFEPLCFSETEAKQMVVDNIDFPNGMDDLKKVYDKGQPILQEDF